MSQLIPDAANYRPVQSYAPRYRFRKIPLYNQSTNSVTIPQGSTTALQFKLGSEVYNLSKSILSYSLSTGATAGAYTWTGQDYPEIINQLQYTDGGQMAINTINFAQNFARLQRKLKTKFIKYLPTDSSEALNPSNSLASNTPAVYPVADGRGNFAAGGCNANVNYFENQYVQVNPVINSATNIQQQYELGIFEDTVFGMDRDLYMGRDMYVNIAAGPGMKIAFTSTSPVDPTAGALALGAAVVTTLSNVYLYLAVEVEPMIRKSVIAKYNTSGISMMIPYVYSQRLGTAITPGTISLQWTIQPAQGLSIKKFLYQPLNNVAAESSNTLMDTANYNGQKILTYQTSIDSNPLQDVYLNCANGATINVNEDDWRENMKFCEDTCILNQQVYQMNWFHQDCFTDVQKVHGAPEENVVNGLPLDVSRTWAINATTGAACPMLQNYIYCIVQRELSVSIQEGIQFDRSKPQPRAEQSEVVQ